MILTRSPLRVSFAGGGTDYPEFFKWTTGCVVGCTIDQYVYVALNAMPPMARENYRFTYRQTESVRDYREFKHPVAREALSLLQWATPVNLATFADLPGESGLGSSSAFTACALKALTSFAGNELDSKEIAELAVLVERRILSEPGGWQDQFQTAFGGMRSYTFGAAGVEVSAPLMDQRLMDEISSAIVLTYVGRESPSAGVAQDTAKAASSDRSRYLEAIGGLAHKLSADLRAAERADRVLDLLVDAVNSGWSLKRDVAAGISTPEVDALVSEGLARGARAGRLLGAGGRGYILFLTHLGERESFVRSLPHRLHVMPHLVGSRTEVIVNDREGAVQGHLGSMRAPQRRPR